MNDSAQRRHDQARSSVRDMLALYGCSSQAALAWWLAELGAARRELENASHTRAGRDACKRKS